MGHPLAVNKTHIMICFIADAFLSSSVLNAVLSGRRTRYKNARMLRTLTRRTRRRREDEESEMKAQRL